MDQEKVTKIDKNQTKPKQRNTKTETNRTSKNKKQFVRKRI